ncbi:MAG: tetraacyldisaccharide 4'-kinase [Planctomycetales bacterium]
MISGERRSPLASLARGGLVALSALYGAGVRARNAFFDRGWKRSFSAGVPVVSVGNVTAGGTGKTPVVAYLAQWFVERGVRPVILSRGYRALDGSANDEKLVLDRLCPGVPHVQNPDRVAGARRAVTEHGAQVLILDDGFQHRRLRRDLDIVLIDALEPFGYGRLLPRGLLREPLAGLRRADWVVITRADRLTDDSRREILATITQHRPPGETLVEVAFPPVGLVNASGERADLAEIRGKNVAAFCGVGNPAGFRRTLQDLGANVVHWRTFPDHHHYTADELRTFAASVHASGAEVFVTTLKDLVKIDANESFESPLWAVNIGVEVLNGADVVEQRLETIRPTR